MDKLKKNQIFKSNVVDLSLDGNGVVKCDGLVAFVPGVLPGEEVEGVVINAKSKYVIGKAQAINNLSIDRVEPKCPYFLKCGGCALQHMNYGAQLNFKRKQVQRLLGDDVIVEGTESSAEWRYRNKVSLPVDENGNIGLYRQGSHTVIGVDDCEITKPFVKPLIAAAKEIIKQGAKIKHVVARELGGSVLVTLVIADKKDIDTKIAIEVLDKYFDKFALNLNINKLDNNVILSDDFIHVCGEKELNVEALEISLKVASGSFFQVNDGVSQEIYKQVLSSVDNNSVVIDCYSGAGLLTAILSKRAKKCYGIEIVKSATKNANELKKINNILNMENINGDCVVELPKLVSKLRNEKINIVVDPPRKGLDRKVVETILSVKPDKIIYISCNPATLARDSKIMREAGYVIALAKTFDMFPQTHHVETLCVLKKQNKIKKEAKAKPNYKDKYFTFYDDVKIASNDEW